MQFPMVKRGVVPEVFPRWLNPRGQSRTNPLFKHWTFLQIATKWSRYSGFRVWHGLGGCL